MEEPQPVHEHDQDPPILQNPPVQNTDPNPNPDPPITAPPDPPVEPLQPPQAAAAPPPAAPPPPQAAAPPPPPPQAAATPPPPPQAAAAPPPPPQAAAALAPPPPPQAAAAALAPPPPPQAAAAAPPPAATIPPPPSVPPESKKRPLDNYSPLQECSYFKMRAVVKDIRPHVLEMLGTVDFRSCKGAEELKEKLKLLMELYKQMTEEKVSITKWKIPPNSSENGVGLKPQEQLQETADKSQPGQVFAKPSEKLQAEHSENQGTHIVGGSAFGWNFITFPGSKPIYYGKNKGIIPSCSSDIVG
ncbi:T1N6.14 PROTEIN [Salix viminalis]|uniref:T1N6.14 PROTEIN n=1 Tax=Salix viminalis TaxID=40686 RepID=A0A9Q0NSZ2_SALVM|nr:T1N6.14 PROTEIN [Salix viminalis]